jgi:hypothetical protein
MLKAIAARQSSPDALPARERTCADSGVRSRGDF